MRIWRNAFYVGRIAGFGAFCRTLRRGWTNNALAAQLDALSAYLLLLRARLLRRNKA